jgi:tetratricopeptide (TPR) repeat protein
MKPSKKQQKNQPKISKKKQLDDDLSFLDEQIKKKDNISDSDKIFLEFKRAVDEVIQSKQQFDHDFIRLLQTTSIENLKDQVQVNILPIIQKMESIYEKYSKYNFQAMEQLNEKYKDLVVKAKIPFLFVKEFLEIEKMNECLITIGDPIQAQDKEDLEKALICLDALIENFGNKYPGYLLKFYHKKALLYRLSEQLNREIEYYEKMLEVIYEQKSYFHEGKGLKDESIRPFFTMKLDKEEIFVKMATTYIDRAHDSMKKTEYQNAIFWSNKVLSFAKENLILRISALSLKVQASYQLTEFQDALDCCNELLLINNNQESLFLKGCCLQKLNRHEEAFECFKKAMDLNPNEEFRGQILLQMANYYAANEAEFLFKNSGNQEIDLHSILSLLLFKSGLYEESLEVISTAIKLGVNNVGADLLKATILSLLGRYEESVNYFKQMLKKADTTEHYLKESNVSKSQIHSNLAETFREMGQYAKALESYKKAIDLDIKTLHSYLGITRLCGDIGIDCGDLYSQLANFSEGKAVDLSFLDSNEIKDKIKAASSKKEDKIEDVAEKKLANEDDVDYLAANLSKHQRIEKLVLDYLSLDEATKEQKKSEINEMIAQDKSLEGFVVRLFASQDGQQENITNIFAADRPGLIHKFFQHKKKGADIKKQQANIQQKEIVISDELEGVHKIKIGDNFKALWFFKFTKEIITKFGDGLSKIKDKINDLRIIKEDAQGQVGFKKHEVKIEGDQKFSMLKLAGLGEDKEVYSKKMYKYYDSLTQKTSILSIFDSCDGHKGLNNVINQKSDGFECQDVDSYQAFETLLLGNV